MESIYGLDANIVAPPFGAILGVLMVVGLDVLGLFFLKKSSIDLKKEGSWLRYQAPLVGVVVLVAILFPSALIGVFSRYFAMSVASALVFLGIFRLWALIAASSYKDIRRTLLSQDRFGYCIGAFIVGYALLSLGPITESDALDYHVGVAIDILNTGRFTFAPEWYHSRLAGSGEVLIALGLSIGSEQFGSLLQFLGILSLTFLFLAKGKQDIESRGWLTLLFLSSPFILAWVASPKPMLLPAAMTTVALMLFHLQIRNLIEDGKHRQLRDCFFLLCSLTMVAFSMKLSFAISGFVILGLAFLALIRARYFWLSIRTIVLSLLIFLVPFVVWKSYHFEVGLLPSLLRSFPGSLPGFDVFFISLQTHRDSSIMFPLSLVLPAGAGSFTTTLGLGVVSIILLSSWRSLMGNTIVLAALFVSVGCLFFGQLSSRFFIEPYYWLLLAIHFDGRINYLNAKYALRIIRASSLGQATLIFCCLIYGLILVLPGAFSPVWREAVMLRSANGYDVMSWVDRVLPVDAVFISHHRAVGLAPRQVIAYDWHSYNVANTKGSEFYTYLTAIKEPGYVLVINERSNTIPQVECDGGIYKGPYQWGTAMRNPFRPYVEYYAWILTVDAHCMQKRRKYDFDKK